jgi:glycosyltransferase involved in cell wall biosynthesis
MISLCLTVWNRTDMVINAIEDVMYDERISEIVIVDDHSALENFYSLQAKLEAVNLNKIKLYRNDQNLDCYKNKREAILKAENKWVIILDSDNKIGTDYLDAIYRTPVWDKSVILQPEFARPLFDFRQMSGQVISKYNVANYTDIKPFLWMINAMNYFVNRDEYLRVWDGSIDPHTSDTILQNYNWLKAGNSIYVVPNMRYDHLVHSGSHYKNNVHKTGNLFEVLMGKIREMK